MQTRSLRGSSGYDRCSAVGATPCGCPFLEDGPPRIWSEPTARSAVGTVGRIHEIRAAEQGNHRGLPLPDMGEGAMNTAQFDLVIQNGRVIDPGAGIDGYFDVAFRDGKVAAVAPQIDPGDGAGNRCAGQAGHAGVGRRACACVRGRLALRNPARSDLPGAGRDHGARRRVGGRGYLQGVSQIHHRGERNPHFRDAEHLVDGHAGGRGRRARRHQVGQHPQGAGDHRGKPRCDPGRESTPVARPELQRSVRHPPAFPGAGSRRCRRVAADGTSAGFLGGIDRSGAGRAAQGRCDDPHVSRHAARDSG